jgi:hypothetical protein
MRHFSKRRLGALLAAGILALAWTGVIAAQENEPSIEGIGDDAAPAPPSIGADIPLTYFGPAPSSVQRELIGPYQLVTAGTIDHDAATITLPLYLGQMTTGESVWYVITDTDDEANAAALGLNFSSKLTYADVGNAVRPAVLEADQSVTFSRGTVDFSPELSLTPGEAPNYFPPAAFQPGAIGDAGYSPLMKLTNAGGYIYNAPMVAYNVDADTLNQFCEGSPDRSIVHDKVVSICPEEGTVTLSLTLGFSFARPVWYLSMDASVDLAAAMEVVTLAPGLADIPVGGDDSFVSAVERIFPVVNGPTGVDNPQRQGFNSALAGEGGPLNTLGGIPTIATDYSPLWDLNPVVWTQEAIDLGYRSRVTEEFFILGLVQDGWLTGLDGGEFGSVGIIVNCPVVFRFL